MPALGTGVRVHICKSENSRFKSQFGGCHGADADLAWSSPSAAGVTWHQAIWDSLSSGSPATVSKSSSSIPGGIICDSQSNIIR